MRINCHCHIFNLQSVFTQETLGILKRRLDDSVLKRAAAKFAEHFVVEELDEAKENILEKFIDACFTGGDAVVSTGFSVLGMDKATVDSIRKHRLHDIYEFLEIAFADSVDKVTDRIMLQQNADDAIAPLMMDILKEDNEINARLFEQQLNAYSRQVERYPGRIFPFVAANPLRNNVVDLVTNALGNKGFIGVKLYPSLGYQVSNPRLMDIYAYCNEKDVPIIQHCNKGGFYAEESFIEYCNPKYWRKILDEYDRLKVCFGHFGGQKYFLGEKEDESWTETIIDMMKDEKYKGRVFADVSYHTDQMVLEAFSDKPKQYYGKLEKLLADPNIGPQVLWGTDYFMIRKELSESSYWGVFQRRLSEDYFNKISKRNAQRWLGLPMGMPVGKNIQEYVDFIRNSHDCNKDECPDWLNQLL